MARSNQASNIYSMTITCIRNARWVVAWDAHLQQHYFRNDIDVVFDGNRIVHVDPAYAGKVDREIDGAGFCVMPGMVNVHTHLQSESLGRGLIEELGNPRRSTRPASSTRSRCS